MKDLSNENIIHVKQNGVQYIQFRKLLEYKDIINHGYGIGIDKNYRTIGATPEIKLTKQEYENALNNYKHLCDSIGITYEGIIKPYQKHTRNIKIVAQKTEKNNPEFEINLYDETDGLITKNKNITLATTNADCILLLFFDPVKKVIANVHSGWKGTLQKISVETVNNMKQEFECNLQDIICCICPSIRKCHFKVHADVQEQFYNEFKGLEEINELIVKVPDEDRWAIDTVEINKIILKQTGLKQENIIDCGICSVCNCDLIHSYRVEKQGYGLGTAIIELK